MLLELAEVIGDSAIYIVSVWPVRSFFLFGQKQSGVPSEEIQQLE